MTTPLPLKLLLPLTTPCISISRISSDKSLKSSNTGNPNFNPYHNSCHNASSQFQHRCFRKDRRFLSRPPWLCGHMRREQDDRSRIYGVEKILCMFGPDEEIGTQIPTQAQSVVGGSGVLMASEFKPVPDVDYLQELLAIQQQGPRAIGFFGTRNMGFMHQELIEILSYAMVITKNHIYTSGASGTNAAVIRGALRAEKQEFLTVILPQSLKKQPPESQELLSKVKNVIEKPHNDHLPLIEASRLCNMDIISHVQQVICFAFHDSKLLMETCQEAKHLRKIVTLFYLD
ncbi:Cysteine sulfinate desulfinase/cysteine desulfurase [Quillaja saponaria]|uniref:Cysteine sulfinate desulfinase/cysteine desulfurase n=1 Tax=Quillaja saponaria TaxID=32244 RepID=A0AAD7VLQ2_QUISA|nr:Cysteine sulfinate desulfinase/cysteine desulfurase [Quillaja saponaria]